MLVAQIQSAFENDYFTSSAEIKQKIQLVKGCVVKKEGIKTYVNGELMPNSFPTTYFLRFIRPTDKIDSIEDGTYVVNENGFLPNHACPTKIKNERNNDGDIYKFGKDSIQADEYKKYHSQFFGI